jgi:ribonuclease BN (tRNA processing enzyme)
MKIYFLGTGAGSTWGSKRFKAGIYVKSEGSSVILDMGSGVNYRIEDLKLTDFKAVFITHLHIDHINGIPDHLVQRTINQMPTIDIYSPPGFSELFKTYTYLGNGISANIHEDKLPNARIGELEVYSVEGCHKIYDVAYIVTDGEKSILYTGDTLEPCESITRVIKEVDLVIHEASCIEDCSKYGHTSVKQIINLFPREKVILTHIPSQIEDKVREIAKGYNIAYDGLIIDV